MSAGRVAGTVVSSVLYALIPVFVVAWRLQRKLAAHRLERNARRGAAS